MAKKRDLLIQIKNPFAGREGRYRRKNNLEMGGSKQKRTRFEAFCKKEMGKKWKIIERIYIAYFQAVVWKTSEKTKTIKKADLLAKHARDRLKDLLSARKKSGKNWKQNWFTKFISGFSLLLMELMEELNLQKINPSGWNKPFNGTVCQKFSMGRRTWLFRLVTKRF